MSERDQDPRKQAEPRNPETGDEGSEGHPGEEILAANVERLLARADEGASLPAEARARMLAKIQAEAGAGADASATTRKPPHAPPERISEAAKAKARADIGGQPSSSTRRFRVTPAAIFSTLAAAFILLWLFSAEHGWFGAGGEDEERLALHQQDTGVRELTLADGSRAIMRAGTKLEELSEGHLRLLAGEVLIEAGELAEPLIVETPQGRAVVEGARVLIRSGAEETLTAVLRGRARVSGGTEAAAEQAEALVLRSGEQALIDAGGQARRVLGKRLSYEVDWARELLAPAQTPEALRRGNLLARVPRRTGQPLSDHEWPLPIRRMVVDVHVEDGHLRTTIDQTFFNHVGRNLEGVYQFPLPANAAIARLAMYVDGERMEAGVVERDRGRNIYEQIVHRRRDPALLEWMQGNLFRVRVFPLPAKTEKRILLSYTQPLDELYGTGELRVPIPEIDTPVGELTYRIHLAEGQDFELEGQNHAYELRDEGGERIAEFTANNHTIGADIFARLKPKAGVEERPAVELLSTEAREGRRHVAVRLRPDLSELVPEATDAPARDIVVLVDTSASRGGPELEAQRRFLTALLDHLDADDRVAIQAFDSHVRWFSPALEPVRRLDRKALAAFLDREADIGLGNTRIGEALGAASELFEASDAPFRDNRPRLAHVLYLGDGLDSDLSVDDPGFASMRARLAEQARFVAVSFGAGYDDALLDRLAADSAGLHTHVEAGDATQWRALELLSTLATPRVLELEARLLDASGQVLAAERSHADRRSIAGGEVFELLAELDPDAGEPVAVELRGKAANVFVGEPRDWSRRFDLPAAKVHAGPSWIPRAWARAQVAALSEDVEANAEAITKLGLEHFLVTPTTSLLVLENERMYKNFAVHRPSEDSWARYDAPESIEVVRESSAAAGHGEYVVRTPISMLASYGGGLGSAWRRRSGGVSPTVPLDGTIGLGNLGLIGRGAGGRGTGFGYGLGGRGARATGSSSRLAGGKRADLPDESKSSKRKEDVDFKGFVRADNRQQSGWSRGPKVAEQQVATAEEAMDVPVSQTVARFGSGLMANVEGASAIGGLWPGARPYPQALHYSWDPRLDDLAELAPALFEDDFDLERERLLLTGLEGEQGSVSDAAAELIAQARQAQADARFELPEGGTLHIDDQNRFALELERWGFLDERVVYDGEELRASYPELGLSVRREVGPTSPALLGSWVPWMVPPVEHLARFYRVERSGPTTLTLRPVGAADDEPTLEVELDGEGRVLALRMMEGERELSSTRFEWSEDALIIRDGQVERRLKIEPGATQIPELEQLEATTVSLPLPSPADLELELEQAEAGSAEWIAIQHQRLAGFAALRDRAATFAVLEELAEQAGRALPGELALAGASFSQAQPEAIDDVLAAAGEDDPVAAFLRAGIQIRRNKARAMAKLADADELAATPVGFLASYRVILHEAEHRPGAGALKRLQTFLERYDHPSFAYVATVQLTNRWWSSYDRRADAWLALAEQGGAWKYYALHQAGMAKYNRGKPAEAAEIFERAFAEARADERMPVVDWGVKWALTRTLGEAGWQLAWTRLRERVAKSGDPAMIVGFLHAAQSLQRIDEAQRVLDRLEPSELDPAAALVLFDTLVAYRRQAEAGAVIADLLERAGDSPAVLLRASSYAEQQGRLDEAASTLERAIALSLEHEGMSLAELRGAFAALFDLRARQARPLNAGAKGRAAALERALAVADRWRREDPDNQDIDRRCAELLWALDLDDEAWRQLASSIDRHPGEGEALAWVADVLEKNGKLERADRVWRRAIAVEPTDPSHRLRRAQNLLASGRDDEAAELIDAVVEGEWQPRFEFVVTQAERLRELL